MPSKTEPEHVQTIVIGGGQAGLSVGHFLARQNLPFVILNADKRIGDSWRNRWDSLRLFTPARFDGLAGMPFPAPGHVFPTKDQMADYLQSYADHFSLPVRNGVRVDGLWREGRRYIVSAADRRFVAEHIVVAMAAYQTPKVPKFALDIDPRIVQLHSKEYRNPKQLKEGGVLIAGAGNSGAEIALDLARYHHIWLAGRDTGHLPFKIGGLAARLFLQRLILRFVFHRVLTIRTPLGRKARPKILSRGGPLIRTRPQELKAAGVERVPRIAGVRNGMPLLEDGRVMDVSNIIWCTGFHPGFSSWVHLPVLEKNGFPKHDGGVVMDEPGLYFVGLPFIYAFSSTMVHGIARDAERIAGEIENRIRTSAERAPAPEVSIEDVKSVAINR